jgi:glutamine---fructose-6-phosphate transaminase (isomerizing)
MCGIFGIIAAQDLPIDYTFVQKILKKLFQLSESRGKESSGIAVHDFKNNKIWITKDQIPASKLINSRSYSDFLDKSIAHNFNCIKLNNPLAVIAHSRLVTNGTQQNNNNNQPVIKDGTVVIHNGIITNVDKLWDKYKDQLTRQSEVDTEVLAALIRLKLSQEKDVRSAIRQVFLEIEGAASFAALTNESRLAILATNTGSLYYLIDKSRKLIIFVSEEKFLLDLQKNSEFRELIGECKINWLQPFTGKAINLLDFNMMDFSWIDQGDLKIPIANFPSAELVNLSTQKSDLSFSEQTITLPTAHSSLLEFNQAEISALKRCSKCILPETFPFIEFDNDGTCNYCRRYIPKPKNNREQELKNIVEKYIKPNGRPSCLMAFSGGRDSSYGLHYLRNVVGLHIITFTYDWGMVTDLARRNIARITGKLGIENILVSANIQMKRSNIRKNVSAWLKKPALGMIPLFMAGDKQFFYYMNKIRKDTNISLNIWCANKLENTDFKVGFCGISPQFNKSRIDHLPLRSKVELALYYTKNFLSNPSYFNSSIYDTLWAYYSYYAEARTDHYQLFDFIPWDEKTIEETLIKEYNWELAPDSRSSWRIGDGTASFYNYIYYTVAGFSEFDTFRSNQIREGILKREEALKLVTEENQPRADSIKWYFDTIDINFEDAIKTINKIPKYYR